MLFPYVRILVLLTKPIAVVGPNSRVDTKVDAKNRNRIGDKVNPCRSPCSRVCVHLGKFLARAR